MRKPFKGARLRYHAVDARLVTLDARRERGYEYSVRSGRQPLIKGYLLRLSGDTQIDLGVRRATLHPTAHSYGRSPAPSVPAVHSALCFA